MNAEEIDKYCMTYGELSDLVKHVERMVSRLTIGADVHGEANSIVCHVRNVCDEAMYAKFKAEVRVLKMSREKIENEIKLALIAKLRS